MKEILTIIGARPQFIKAALVSKALTEEGIPERIIHTGQHYDPEMSDVFFDELGVPPPSANLNAGSGTHGKQTGIMLEKIEEYILGMDPKPAFLLTYGDTNSTLAGALAASKLHVPVIHVEAGLRSFNREMPEEINRVLTDHLSSLLFCSSQTGVAQLAREGITKNVHDVGDVMMDASQTFHQIAKKKGIRPKMDVPYALMTVHRPSNTDNPKNLRAILDAVGGLPLPVLWPVHPRARKQLEGIQTPENLLLSEPLGYLEMLVHVEGAEAVLTDSGGLQKEAYWLKRRCITLREETEWVETLAGGWNRLTGPDARKIANAFNSRPITGWKPLYGDGTACRKIARTIRKAMPE